MKNKIKQKIATVSSLILGLTLGLPNQPAQATGKSCAKFGINDTCLTVNGSGLAVNSLKAEFVIKPSERCIPNWRYRISFRDINNREYASLNGPIHRTCDKSGNFSKTYPRPYRARQGKICASLYDFTDTYITQSCVSIRP
jgi:hypothetical protein